MEHLSGGGLEVGKKAFRNWWKKITTNKNYDEFLNARDKFLGSLRQRSILKGVKETFERVRHIGFGKEDGLATYEGYRNERRTSAIPKEQKIYSDIITNYEQKYGTESTSGLHENSILRKPLQREEGRGTQGTVQEKTTNLAGLSGAIQTGKENGLRNHVPAEPTHEYPIGGNVVEPYDINREQEITNQ